MRPDSPELRREYDSNVNKLRREASSASISFINDPRVSYAYVNEIDNRIYNIEKDINRCIILERANYFILEEIRNIQQQRSQLLNDDVKAQVIIKKMNDDNDRRKSTLLNNLILANVGFVSGILQIVGGAGMCGASLGIACAPGSLLIAHGTNNVYENGYYIITLKPTTGYLKKAYEQAVHMAGYNASVGDIVYSGVDLGLSAYGVTRKILEPDTFRLFRYMKSDFIRGWQEMGKKGMAIEFVGDTATVLSTYPQLQTVGKGK